MSRVIKRLTLKTFAEHLTSEGFSMFPVVYWAKISEHGEEIHRISVDLIIHS